MADEQEPLPCIRRLWPGDFAAFRAHFKRLDSWTRRERFGRAMGDDALDSYVDAAHRAGTLVFGAFDGPSLVAAAELRLLGSTFPLAAEAAFSVERDWQDRGIGDALLARVIGASQNRSISTVHLVCIARNGRMRHLAAKHGARLSFHDGDVEGRLAPPWPTPRSMLAEMIGEASGLVTAVLEWPREAPDADRFRRS